MKRVVAHSNVKNKEMDMSLTTEQMELARQYAINASREASVLKGFPGQASINFNKVAVIGAGIMGTGITMALINSGIEVCLIDTNEEALNLGFSRIKDNYLRGVKRGKLSSEEVEQKLARIVLSTKLDSVASSDVIIEAVWEQLTLKRELFESIDSFAKPGALLATNTSGLDIDKISEVTNRPEDVIGLHFFTPAQSMKLLEVIRGSQTASQTIVNAMALGKKLDKVSVLVECCPGFVGNRIFKKREDQASKMLLEGATPEQIDRVLREFGMPMGSFELQDMTGGIELRYRRRQEDGSKDWLGDRMFELGRLGQKTSKGYYRYEVGDRNPIVDPEFEEVLIEASEVAGIERREIDDEEIFYRLLLPMINEASKIIDEKIVIKPTDIDAVWLNGYGWPVWRGGVLYEADRIGTKEILKHMEDYHQKFGETFEPSSLLRKLGEADKTFL